MYLLLTFVVWYILIYFSNINNISITVNRSNFTVAFFKAVFFANHAEGKTLAGAGPYISEVAKNITSNNVLLLTYKSWYSPKVVI